MRQFQNLLYFGGCCFLQALNYKPCCIDMQFHMHTNPSLWLRKSTFYFLQMWTVFTSNFGLPLCICSIHYNELETGLYHYGSLLWTSHLWLHLWCLNMSKFWSTTLYQCTQWTFHPGIPFPNFCHTTRTSGFCAYLWYWPLPSLHEPEIKDAHYLAN